MYWGIDLGGTKIEGIVLGDRHPDSVLARERMDTEASGGYRHILSRIVQIVDQLSERTGSRPESIGIGTPGTLDPATGLLKNSNTLCLNGQPVQHDLEALLGIRVNLANDANCFALAEYHLGAASGMTPRPEVLFGVIMGTGVGGGVVVDGKIIRGHHGIGGEWGHMTLIPDGDPCYCGRKGCVETVISGTALQEYYFNKTGIHKKLAAILDDPEDPMAGEVKSRLIFYFGRALGQIINILDPDVIVLGGGLSRLPFLYTEGRQETAAHLFNPVLTTPVLPPQLGDSAGVFGAAMLISS